MDDLRCGATKGTKGSDTLGELIPSMSHSESFSASDSGCRIRRSCVDRGFSN